MLRPEAPRTARPSPELAPHWHTGALVGLIACVAVAGTLLQRSAWIGAAAAPPAAAERSALALYLPVLLVNFALTLWVCRCFRGHNALPELIGRRWETFGRAAGDLGLALILCVFIQGCEVLAMHYLGAPGAGRNAAARALLPRTEAERLTWCLVAACVGFSEEVVYRGYLQTQFSAFTGRQSAGVVLQAVLFGVAHADQGGAMMMRVAGYGVLLGVVAAVRGSLLAGVGCHVLIDAAGGWLH